MRAARVTVVVPCECMCVFSLICRLTLWNRKIEIHQRIHRNTGTILNFADFVKNASFKIMAKFAHLEQLWHSSAVFSTK